MSLFYLKICWETHLSANKDLPLPLGRGVCETKSKNGHARPRKPFICRMVSEGARPWGRGRSGDCEFIAPTGADALGAQHRSKPLLAIIFSKTPEISQELLPVLVLNFRAISPLQ